jgi:LysM repeat protein
MASGAVSSPPMTESPEDPTPRRTAASSRASVATTEPVREVCPFLLAADAGWRAVQPTRDHRCTATTPVSPLSLAKQRELCLLPAHFGCATYLAAREIAAERGGAPVEGGLWPETRSAVLSLEPAHRGRTQVAGLTGRGTGQAVLIGLMVVAFIVLVVARVTPPVSGDPPASFDAGVIGSAAAGSSDTAFPSPTSAPSPVTTPPASPSEVPVSAPPSSAPASEGPSVNPSAGPTSSPAGETYRVRPGDTLSGIAARYGVTLRALRLANDIPPGGIIRPGRVLVIPTS